MKRKINRDRDWGFEVVKWAALLFFVVEIWGVVTALPAKAQEVIGEPEIELTCSIDTREGRAEVSCLAVSPSHRCQVREVSAETGPSIPGRGVRSKLSLFCPTRLSTSIDPHAELFETPKGCRWTVPVRGVDRLMYACVGAPGSRQRKLGKFYVPTPENLRAG